MIIVTIIAFIVIFSLLVLVHEWGHFIMARRAGMKVEEFGIGLPPRAKALYKDKKGTIYSLNYIPFGGYVRLYGEDTSDPKALQAKNSFASKSIGARAGVIVAGVFMNLVLAWALITIGFTFGMRPFLVTDQDFASAVKAGHVVTTPVLYIHEVMPDLPGSASGLRSGDLIIDVNGQGVPAAEDFRSVLKPKEQNHLKVLRDEKELSFDLLPNAEDKVGLSISREEWVTQVNPVRYPFYLAPLKSFQEVQRLSVLTVEMLGKVVVSLVSKFTVPEGVAGPVGIARMTHSFVKQGFMAVLQFTALISISLGVINIMPFPGLDGGRFLFIAFEFVLRRRPNAKWEAAIHTVGFGLLMLLILVVTWNDIVQLINR